MFGEVPVKYLAMSICYRCLPEEHKVHVEYSVNCGEYQLCELWCISVVILGLVHCEINTFLTGTCLPFGISDRVTNRVNATDVY